MKHPLVFVLGLALIATGCSGKSDSSSQDNSGQTGGASSAPKTSEGVKSDAATALAVYPGATKFASQFIKPMTVCGHKMTPIVYRVADPEAKVTAWYLSKMPGARTMALPGADVGGTGMSGSFILSSDGASSVVVEQMHFGALEKTAQKYGMANGTTLGLSRYDPPLSADEIQLIETASHGDPAARAAAKARFKKQCGGNGFSLAP